VPQDVRFSHGEIPIENIEEFAFDTTDVASAKYARAQGPVVVLDRPVVNILRICSVKSTLMSPGRDNEIRYGPCLQV